MSRPGVGRSRGRQASRERGRGSKKGNPRHDSVMDELRKEAAQAQKDMRKSGGYLQWKDLEDGNILVFALYDEDRDVEGWCDIKEHTPKDSNILMTFNIFKTSRYKLIDIDGNVIKHEDAFEAEDDGTEPEDNFFDMPLREGMVPKFEDALEDGMTVCRMTGHVIKTFTPKGGTRPVDYHDCDILFGSDDSVSGKILWREEK